MSHIEYRQNHVRRGPLLHVGKTVLFHSELLDSIYYFDRAQELLAFELSLVVTFSRDAGGRVTTVGRRTRRELSPLTFRYDERGLLVEMQDGDDSTFFWYSPDCSPTGAEKRFLDGAIIRHDYALDGQRNPFFARWDLFWGTSFIVETWPTLLSGHNLLRQANSVGSVVSQVVNEYSYRSDGTLHTQILTLSNVGAPNEQTRVVYQYTFESASVASSRTTAPRP